MLYNYNYELLREREKWLRTILKLEHGIPSHDTFCDVYSAIEPEAITQPFAQWVETIRQKISGEVVAIDGKTVCASRDVPKNKKAVHMLPVAFPERLQPHILY